MTDENEALDDVLDYMHAYDFEFDCFAGGFSVPIPEFDSYDSEACSWVNDFCSLISVLKINYWSVE